MNPNNPFAKLQDNPFSILPFSAVFKITSHGRGVFTEELIQRDLTAAEAWELCSELNMNRPAVPDHHYTTASIDPDDPNPTTGMIDNE